MVYLLTTLFIATGVYYDCCLINWYADGECACKFHSDPDHGKLWSYDAGKDKSARDNVR